MSRLWPTVQKKISSFNDQLNQILPSIKMYTKSSFLDTLTLELVNHIIPDRRFLVSLEWARLIRVAICCCPSAQNSRWSLPTPTSNTSKFIRIFGYIKDPNIGTSSITSSRESVIYQMGEVNCITDHVMVNSLPNNEWGGE